MSKLKSTLIKLSAVVFALSVSLALVFMPKTEDVNAADNADFYVVSSSIRVNPNEPYTGLKFTYDIQSGWYAAHDCTSAVIGALIFPAKNGEVDTTKSSTDNMNALDGDNIIWGSYGGALTPSASIVFDDEQIKQLIAEKRNYRKEDNSLDVSKVTAEDLNAVKAGLFAMEFTVYPYAIANGKTYWARTSHTTSMQKVAASTLVSIDQNPNQDKDGKIREAALKYVGGSYSYHEGYATVSDGKVYLDGIDGYQASEDAIASLGNVNAQVENGEIYLNGELTASNTTQKLYIFENGSLKIVNLLLADNAITTAEEFVNYVDNSKWAEGDNPFKKITVLANDIDMSTTDDLYIEVAKPFAGTFDGRGHVISNLTIAKSVSGTVYSALFGDLQNDTHIKNVAFDEITSIGFNVNSGLLSTNLRGTVENIYVKFSKTSEVQQIFMYTTIGYLTNCIIEAPYNEDLDVNKWIDDHDADWGRTYLSRMIERAGGSNMTNVKVITQLPLILYGEGNMAEPAYSSGAVSNWRNWFAYGENESKLWYDFEYFYNATDDAEAPGLGLERGTANVQNTQVIVDGQSMKQGKTRVWKGVERYETLDEMVATGDLSAFVNSGMWKMENGKLVWAKGENVTTYIGGEYEAAENKLKSTALNGEVVKKVTVNGVELSRENGEYTVDENGYLTSIYGKKSANDPKNGISYKVNSADNDILDEVIFYTDTGKYELSFVNYYTKVIDTVAELKQVLDIDYTVVTNPTEPRVSQNGIVYNTHTDGKEYVYNAGIYKLGANIDMYDAVNEDYITLDYTGISITYTKFYSTYYNVYNVVSGGFSGAFDGDGFVIDNFKPTEHGLFGVLSTIGSGLTTGADIKNVAFTNVLTTEQTGVKFFPVIAAYVSSLETVAQNLSNVYVSYSKDATDMFGLIATPTVKLYMKNVYVVNEKGYSPINEDWKDQYLFADGTTTLQKGKYYENFFHPDNNGTHFGYTGSLFTNVYKLDNVTKEYIDNVYVASPASLSFAAPISYLQSYLFSIDYGKRTMILEPNYPTKLSCFYNRKINGTVAKCYMCKGCGYAYETAVCTRGCENATFTEKGTVNSRFTKMQAYAGNETTGNIPFPVDLAPQIKAEITAEPVIENGVLKNGIGKVAGYYLHGYICDTCGKYASLYEGTKCTFNECTGTMNVATSDKNSEYDTTTVGVDFWSSPYAYVWAFPDLTKFSVNAKINGSDSIVRLAGVTRYDTIAELEQNVDFKASNFATNKYWKVTEDGKLYWASLYV